MIDLPWDCAVVAVAAATALEKHGVESRALAVICVRRPQKRHIVAVFLYRNRLRVYDRKGTITLSVRFNFKSSPAAIAKAWKAHPFCDFELPVVGGEWY